MWTCQKCKRQFKNENQSHYCGEKIENIDDYINSFDQDCRKILKEYRQLIKTYLPMAKEKISWSMPTFREIKNIIHFAGHKNHLGLYPGPKAIEFFSKDFEDLGLKFSKGALQIPYTREIPKDLIKRICEFAYKNQ